MTLIGTDDQELVSRVNCITLQNGKMSVGATPVRHISVTDPTAGGA